MQKPAKQALIYWLSASVLIFAAIVMLLGRPHNPDAVGEAIGQVIARTGIPALIVWWLARHRNPLWSWLQFGSIYLMVFVGFALLTVVGRVRAEEPLPFTATFPAAWSVERLAGASSAPQDLAGGVRQRARWDGADGKAVIEIACAWRENYDHPDVDEQVHGMIKGVTEMIAKHGITLEHGAIRTLLKGHRDWRVVDLRAKGASSTQFQQTAALTLTERCLVIAMLAGTPQAYALQSAEFESVLEHTHFDTTSPTRAPAAD
jgi:hypothetical protein